MIILIYWCIVPVFSMYYSYVTRTDADLLIYLSGLSSGVLGIYLTILRVIKENVMEKLKDKSYVVQHLPQLTFVFNVGLEFVFGVSCKR